MAAQTFGSSGPTSGCTATANGRSPRHRTASGRRKVEAMILPLLSLVAAASAPADCAARLEPEIELSSFTARDDAPPPSPAELETLRHAAGDAFKRAAGSLCQTGQIQPATLAPFRKLLILSASGATEANVYDDP